MPLSRRRCVRLERWRDSLRSAYDGGARMTREWGPGRVLVTVAIVLVAGCRSLGGSCHDPQPYEQAQELPPLRIPPGLEAPDTRNALRIPELNEPEPPPRKPGDPCLDEPPRYSAPLEERPRA